MTESTPHSTENDPPTHQIDVQILGDRVRVRDLAHPERPELNFTIEEWEAFRAGAENGEFDFG